MHILTDGCLARCHPPPTHPTLLCVREILWASEKFTFWPAVLLPCPHNKWKDPFSHAMSQAVPSLCFPFIYFHISQSDAKWASLGLRWISARLNVSKPCLCCYCTCGKKQILVKVWDVCNTGRQLLSFFFFFLNMYPLYQSWLNRRACCGFSVRWSMLCSCSWTSYVTELVMCQSHNHSWGCKAVFSWHSENNIF